MFGMVCFVCKGIQAKVCVSEGCKEGLCYGLRVKKGVCLFCPPSPLFNIGWVGVGW